MRVQTRQALVEPLDAFKALLPALLRGRRGDSCGRAMPGAGPRPRPRRFEDTVKAAIAANDRLQRASLDELDRLLIARIGGLTEP